MDAVRRLVELGTGLSDEARFSGARKIIPKSINGMVSCGAFSMNSFLVPIRIDVDVDGYKLRDSLIWALPANESFSDVTLTGFDLQKKYVNDKFNEDGIVENFCRHTCADFDVPFHVVGPVLMRSLVEQLAEGREANQIINSIGGVKAFRGMRFVLNIDITVGLDRLVDSVEWDLGDETTDIHDYARTFVGELFYVPFWGSHQRFNPLTINTNSKNTAEEFEGAVVVDIIDQLYRLRRAIALVGFTKTNSGTFIINDVELNSLIISSKLGNTLGSNKKQGIRRDPNKLDEFTPFITEIDPLELEKIEISRERETRRRRRQGRVVNTRKLITNSSGKQSTSTPSNGAVSYSNWTQLSPPKTMRTPLSYRGSLHRIIPRFGEDGDEYDDESVNSGRLDRTASTGSNFNIVRGGPGIRRGRGRGSGRKRGESGSRGRRA